MRCRPGVAGTSLLPGTVGFGAVGLGAIGLGAFGVNVATRGYRRATRRAGARLAGYPVRAVDLAHGRVTYVDAGPRDAPPVLSMHGIFGGYDQAYDVVHEHDAGYRIIAPSRFGYLGSDVRGRGTPADQAAVCAELLDHLGIETAVVLGASAGGTPAIRFALDHPERTRGLILLSAAMPSATRPERCPRYQGPPPPLCTDLVMYLLSPLFPALMSMPASTIGTILPVAPRRRGVILDASVTNPDMARNFDDYDIERLQPPVLVLQAKDDALATYDRTMAAVPRFRNVTFVPFEDGGHLLVGHREEVTRAIEDFVRGTRARQPQDA